jgi:hypothetical protein
MKVSDNAKKETNSNFIEFYTPFFMFIGFFNIYSLIANFNGAVNVVLADLNNDNDMDLVAIAQITGKLSYFRNIGENEYSEIIFSDNFGGPGIMILDHNFDEYLDILACAGRQDEI